MVIVVSVHCITCHVQDVMHVHMYLHMDTNIFVYTDTLFVIHTCSSVDSGKGEDLSSSCESAVFESQVEGQVSATISRLVN